MNIYCDKHGQLRPCTDCLTNSLYDDALFADDYLCEAYTRGVADGRRELEQSLAAAESRIAELVKGIQQAMEELTETGTCHETLEKLIEVE